MRWLGVHFEQPPSPRTPSRIQGCATGSNAALRAVSGGNDTLVRWTCRTMSRQRRILRPWREKDRSPLTQRRRVTFPIGHIRAASAILIG